MVTEISLGYSAVLHISRLKDQGLLTPEMISLMKRNNCIKSI